MKLTFRGYRIYRSIRLDEASTMVPILLLNAVQKNAYKKVINERFRLRFLNSVFTSVTSRGETVDSRSNLTTIGDEEFNFLLNAFFGFALAINSYRDNGGFSKRCLTIAK